jgi:hypothetical protein
MKDWGTKYHGCVYTALSNLATDWKKIADATPKPGEEWLQDVAREQAKKYGDALVAFEMLW